MPETALYLHLNYLRRADVAWRTGKVFVIAIGSSSYGDISEGDFGKWLALGKKRQPLGLPLASVISS